MKLLSMLSGTAALLPFALVVQAQGPGDAQRGAQVFNQCKICHSLEAGKNLVGPSLHGVIGRKVGSVPGYAYSPAMKNADVTWNDNTLSKYLTDPKAFIPRDKMPFPGHQESKPARGPACLSASSNPIRLPGGHLNWTNPRS